MFRDRKKLSTFDYSTSLDVLADALNRAEMEEAAFFLSHGLPTERTSVSKQYDRAIKWLKEKVESERKQSAVIEPVPAQAAVSDQPRPEFIRLPKTGHLCPYTGMTRAYINELILPTERNDFKPKVKSFCLRQRGAKTGVRLIDYQSLRDYILARG